MPKVGAAAKPATTKAPAEQPIDDPEWNAGPPPARKRTTPKAGTEDDPWAGGSPPPGAEEPTKPARKSRAKPKPEPETDAVDDATEPDTMGDWSQPKYASDPGDFEFGSMDDTDDFLSVMWYGPEGTGKTTNLARMLELGPGRMLLINAEGGAKKRALQFHGVDVSRIAVYPKPGQRLTFEGLERLYYKLADDLDKDPNSWVGTGWDSATAIAQYFLDNVIEEDIRKTQEILQRNNRGRSGRAGNVVVRDRFDTDRNDYSVLAQQFRLLLRKYRQLPCHFGVTALLRRDEETKKVDGKPVTVVKYGPAVSPALQNDLLGYVDMVVRTHAEEGRGHNQVWWGRTAPTEDERGKDRMAGLPYELVDPTFDRIRDYLDGEITEDEDPVQKLLLGDRVKRVRRSLAGSAPVIPDDEPDAAEELTGTPEADDRRHHTKDGTPDGPPLAGDEDDEPTKPARRSGKRAAPTKPVADTPPPARKGGKRRTPAETAAKAETQADDNPAKPATARAKSRAAANKSGFSDNPPF